MFQSSALLCLYLFFVCLTIVQWGIDLKTANGIWLFDEGKGKFSIKIPSIGKSSQNSHVTVGYRCMRWGGCYRLVGDAG